MAEMTGFSSDNTPAAVTAAPATAASSCATRVAGAALTSSAMRRRVSGLCARSGGEQPNSGQDAADGSKTERAENHDHANKKVPVNGTTIRSRAQAQARRLIRYSQHFEIQSIWFFMTPVTAP